MDNAFVERGFSDIRSEDRIWCKNCSDSYYAHMWIIRRDIWMRKYIACPVCLSSYQRMWCKGKDIFQIEERN